MTPQRFSPHKAPSPLLRASIEASLPSPGEKNVSRYLAPPNG